MLVHGMAGRLHDKNVGATDVFLNLNVSLAVLKASDQRLPPVHAKKSANFVGQRLVGRTAKDLELVIHTRALWLALVLFVSAHFLFRGGCKGRHGVFDSS